MEKKQVEKEKIAIAEIKADFEAEGEIFDDNDAEKIRDFLYLIAQITYEQHNRNKQATGRANCKVININEKSDESTKSNTLYPCEYRRTG